MRSISCWVLLLVVLFAIFSAPHCAAFLLTSTSTTSTSISLRPHYRSIRLLAQITNEDEDKGKHWTTVGEIAKICTPWVKLLGERLLDSDGKELEYWRVEKEDSAVILTLHRNTLVFPRPMFRPGVGRVTLDFPGGRVPSTAEKPPIDLVPAILQRELNIPDVTNVNDSAIISIESLNEIGWPVNSSFSNQRLFGFYAVLDDTLELDETSILRYETNTGDIEKLLSKDLGCLQCRSVLLEWLRIKG